MRALFLSLPLHGHTNPSLPLVRELVARGEEVIYVSTDAFAAQVEATGARYRAYRNTHLEGISHLQQRMELLAWTLMRTTAELLGEHLESFRALRPDYVITDSVAFWGRWIAPALGVPVITSVTTFAFNRQVLSFGVRRGLRPKSVRILAEKLFYLQRALRLARQLRRRHRVQGPGLRRMMLVDTPLSIVYTSREFQPCAETFDDRFQFIGPSMDARPHAGTFPWDRLTHPVAVYVSMGTLFNRDAAFYRACFEAFRGADFQVILSLGANVSLDATGQPPENFIVLSHVPQLDVLKRVRAFVSHGGMNSVSESLYNAVPVIVIPQVSEQTVVGIRTQQLGAGELLMPADVTPQRLREGVERLLRDRTYRDRAAVIRDSFLTAGGPSRGADAILAFTRPSYGA